MKLLIDDEVCKPEYISARDIERLCNPWFITTTTTSDNKRHISKNNPVKPTIFDKIEYLLSTLMLVCKSPSSSVWFVDVSFSESGNYRVSSLTFDTNKANNFIIRGVSASYTGIGKVGVSLHPTVCNITSYQKRLHTETIYLGDGSLFPIVKRMNVSEYMHKVMAKKLKSSKK